MCSRFMAMDVDVNFIGSRIWCYFEEVRSVLHFGYLLPVLMRYGSGTVIFIDSYGRIAITPETTAVVTDVGICSIKADA